MFCTRCKRNSHYRKDCKAKTFKGGKTRIGYSSSTNNYSGRKFSTYKKKYQRKY